MTAVGFCLAALMYLYFRSEDEHYWIEHKKKLAVVEYCLTAGLLLVVAGLTVFFWRIFP